MLQIRFPMRTSLFLSFLALAVLLGSCDIVEAPGNQAAGYRKFEIDWKSVSYQPDTAFTPFFEYQPDLLDLPDKQWKPIPKGLNRFPADTSVWLHWSWGNPVSRDADWTLEAPRMTHFQLYYQIEGEHRIRSVSSGYLINASEQELVESRKSVVSIFIPRHAKKVHFWAHLASVDQKPIRPSFTFYPTKTWLRKLSLHNLVQGFFQGLFWIMIFYNLLIYFTSRDRTYLYYVGYMVGAAVYFLYYYHYLSSFIFRENPEASSYLWIFSAHSAPIFFFLFTRRFLSTKQLFPRYDKVLRTWVGVRIAFLTVLLAILYGSFNIRLMDAAITWFTVLEMLVVLVLIVRLFQVKKMVGYYYSIGVIGLWVGNALAVMGNTDILPKSGLYIEAGTGLEILLFSLGLGYRIRNNEKQKRKAQEGLIEQLRQNEELKDEANQKLEEKVRERTERINQQKEELYSQRDALETASHHLKKAFTNMSSSVNYARRIQQAMMVSPEQISIAFGSAFLFNRPKDVLGGDLYWYYEGDRCKVVILADCTGHGVPGALMTIVALSIFHNVVEKQQLDDPAEILYACDRELKSFFALEDKRNDGMDMAVLVFEHNSQIARFEGAKLPVFQVTATGEAKLFKGARYPMGHLNREVNKEFETKELTVSKGDRLYLYSDGFQDQFGGAGNRKFMGKKLRALLQETSPLPMDAQRKHIIQTFDDWQGVQSQTDDVLLLGIEYSDE